MSEPVLYGISRKLYRRQPLAAQQPICTGCAFENLKGGRACRAFPCQHCRSVAKPIPDDMPIPTHVQIIELDTPA